MSVWETIEALHHYVYSTDQAELRRQRQQWFWKFVGAYSVLWWVSAGCIPTIEEGKKRLAHFDCYGPSQFAFTFKTVFAPDRKFQQEVDGSSFQACVGD